MLHLANRELRVEIVDTAEKLPSDGHRYCTGAKIWQVHDQIAGPLLTGPEWPEPAPSSFNGQGLPESFRHRTRDGRPLTWNEGRGVAIGIGELAAQPDGTISVVAPCEWMITRSDDRLTFRTRQQVGAFDYELERSVSLSGRTLVSDSSLLNHGSSPLVLQWFAHPFFALTDGVIRAELPSGTSIPENPGFRIEGGVLIQKRRFAHHQDGHMDFLQLPSATNPAFRLSHPTLSHVTFEARLVLSECVVWGNDVTFSIEPYQTLSLPPGVSKQWSLRYEFGSPVPTKLFP